MKRGGYLKRTRSLRAKSVKQVERDAELHAVTPLVHARSHFICEAALEGCTIGVTSEPHHRKRRSQGGPHTLINLLDVCNNCHSRIHDNVDWSYARGLLIRRDSPITPYKGAK